jgi:hypothetical protein
MTVGQLFESAGERKVVWSKRGNEISKKVVCAPTSVSARSKIELKEPKS